MSLSSLSLDSSDEERPPPRTNRVYRERMNPFTFYNEQEFRDRYRVSKTVISELTEQIGHQFESTTQRSYALSALEQILLTISFFATGAFQITVADHIRVHKSTACRIIKKVSSAIAHLRPVYVQMPATEQDRMKVKNGFYNIHLFPNVIGALDCTHVKTASPGGPNAELFRNRKGVFTLNVQAICDSNLIIMDVVARWPGSVHDTTIFNDSPVRADFETGVYGNDFLLGDSGYPCRSYLLTPILNPGSASEEAYNSAQIATRNPIERCFGVLKRRFPCLSMGLRVKHHTAMNIIVACVVLHNIAIKNNDIMEEDMPDEEATIDNEMFVHRDQNSSARSALIQTHFNV